MSLIGARARQVRVADNSTKITALADTKRSTNLPRVLHLINSFEIGGTERQAVELLKRVDLERYDVRLAALRKEGPLYQEIASRFPNVPEFPLTSFYNRNAVRQLLRLRSLLIREQIQILHAHDFYAGVLGAAAARLAGVKVITSQRHLKLSDRWVHDWGTRFIHRLAHRVIVNSVAIRNNILARGIVSNDKVSVIENGVWTAENEIEAGAEVALSEVTCAGRSAGAGRLTSRECLRRELGLGPEAKLVGIVARLQPVKGHRYFIQAASRLAREDAALHFILVGGGPLRGEIEDQAARLGISERVHLLGERADIRLLIPSLDLAVLASLHEGLPNAVMEAMAMGVPIVATEVGGIPQLIRDGDTGYLVPPGDASALADRIMTALKEKENTAMIALRGQQHVMDKFGIKRQVESVERLYDEILSDKPGRLS